MTLSLGHWIFLAIAAGLAGFIDAIAGGGGLIQLPALLIGISDKPIPMILGTNKVPSIFGTSFSAAAYFRKIKPDLHLTAAMAIPAFIGSACGARLAAEFPKSVFRPIIVILLFLVAIYTWKRPHLGMEENLKDLPEPLIDQLKLFEGEGNDKLVPAAKVEAVKPEAAAPMPEEKPAEKPAEAAAELWTLQLVATAEVAEAKRIADKAKAEGFSTVTVKEKGQLKIRLHSADRATIDKAAEKLKRAGLKSFAVKVQ